MSNMEILKLRRIEILAMQVIIVTINLLLATKNILGENLSPTILDPNYL